MKSVALIQPYFLPYFGYFQLIEYVDLVVLYDNVQYTKKGWINRNKIIRNGIVSNITIPLKKDSFSLNINERYLSNNWPEYNQKILRQLSESYEDSKNFKDVFNIVQLILDYNELRLDTFLMNSIKVICDYLEIKTDIISCSSIDSNSLNLKSSERVLNILKKINCNKYVNPIDGKSLYKKNKFKKNDIKLEFLNSTYNKNRINISEDNDKNKNLSIIDSMMNKSKANLIKDLQSFILE
jgi:hypothetical protein